MEVRTLIKRGADHHVYCEDDLFHFEVGSVYIAAVFDGCSTGYKSHFASSLFGKILKKVCQEQEHIEDESIDKVANIIFSRFFGKLKIIQHELNLMDLEIVSTMILAVVKDKNACIYVSGDGCIMSDEKEIKIESPGNAPDYLAYHLNHYYEALDSLKVHNLTFSDSLSICSDGIYSFTDKEGSEVTSAVVDNLLKDTSLLKSDAMLSRKYNLLIKEGYSNYDDLSIIRFIL